MTKTERDERLHGVGGTTCERVADLMNLRLPTLKSRNHALFKRLGVKSLEEFRERLLEDAYGVVPHG